MRHDFNYYWTKKCYQCYGISIKRLWKYYPRFICQENIKIDFVRFSNSAIVPAKGTKDSAGFDLYSVEDVTISSNSIKIIKTDIGFKIRKSFFGKTYARSSLAVRCTEIHGGVIDADYREPIAVVFLNFSDKTLVIEKSDKFCQIVFQKTANHPVLREVDNFNEDKTDRGEGSFGSTNKIKHVCRQDFCQ